MFRAKALSAKIVVFDTTHETNSLGLYLALFVVQNEFGFTETVGNAFIRHQDASSFSRLFRAWKSIFNLVDPSLFMTDGDAAIASGVADAMPGSKHVLCIWHIIFKNAVYHLQKLLSKDEMDTVKTKLWGISLKDDCSLCEDELVHEWNDIVVYIYQKYCSSTYFHH